ncbi:MAG: radical SAM family heme chaperone HemW [Lachnospiraceae bacterium]|nr:radical SAM family heme chaperone HemW [Lachnospiraceae bacterium]
MSRRMSIYIHIPFCIKKCGYCDFLSFPVRQYGNRRTLTFEGGCLDEVPEEYLQRLLCEIRQESSDYADREVDTIFVGGGTPSLLLPRQVTDLFDRVYQSYHVVSGAEITMEANPGTLSKEKLKSYRQMGVNRLSIGLQSADDGELAALGRIHRFQDFQESYELARDCGFQNINIDLMSGLPGQSVESWIRTLHTVVKFEPEHISAYGLIIEEGTLFYQRYGADGVDGKLLSEPDGVEKLPSEEDERQMYYDTGEVLGKCGYRQYEISNYAKDGYECRHNIGYWTRKEYAGFGLGAASMINNKRWKNTSDLKKYMKNVESGDGTVRGNGIRESAGTLKEEMQVLPVQEQMEETMFLGLRMTRGVSKEEFKALYGIDMEALYGSWIYKMVAEGLLLDGDRICLSERGRDLANYVMAGFLQG